MGTNYWEDEGYQKHDGPPHKELPPVNDEPRVKHISRDGDGCKGSNGASGDGEAGGGGDDDDDDDDDERKAVAALSLTGDESAVAATGDADKKKKKRKRPKKKKTGSLKQTSPPRVPVHDLFPNGEYPTGQFMEYATPPVQTTRRAQEGEVRHAGRPNLDDEAFLQSYRRAAEVHRQTRRWVQETVRPGHTLTEIATGVDDSVRALLGNPGLEAGAALKSGLGFPTGLSLNNCVAHYTPNPGHKDIVLQKEDVMKVDFGVHINGWIVDSAFTMSFDPTYDNLLAAVKDATNTGIKTAGVDVRISDVSAAIQEAMESYEVEIRGKLIPVKAVRNLCGHDIKHWRIHGSKQIPFIRNSDQTKMEEDEIFAIETFGTTGRAYLRDGPGVYGYGLPKNPPKTVSLPMASATRLYKTIRENFGTIVFCRRNLEYLGLEKYLAGLNYLVSNGLLESYEPLVDVPGSYSAQFEHTILLRESKKEVLSRGEDY